MKIFTPLLHVTDNIRDFFRKKFLKNVHSSGTKTNLRCISGKSVIQLRGPDETTDNMAYGYRRTSIGRAKHGYYPVSHTTPFIDFINTQKH